MAESSTSHIESPQAALGPAYMLLLWVVVTQVVWAFAFMGMPEATPEWLVRARSACFGIDSTGLPDTRGWMLLAVAPLSFLIALVIAYGGMELRESMAQVLRSPPRRAFIAAVFLAVIFQGTQIAQRLANGWAVLRAQEISVADDSRLPAGYPQLMRPAPDFSLLNQKGEKVSLATLRGDVVLFSFVFAHCQTVCPTITRSLRMAADALGRKHLRVVVVTLDPRRDTPSALPQLAAHWELSGRDMALSGPVAEVERVLQAYNAGAVRDEITGDVAHPALVYVMDEQGILRYALTNPQQNWIVDAVRSVSPALG